MLTQLWPLSLFPARLFQGTLGRRGGDHSWVSGHWEDKPKCPKNGGGRVGELGDEGQGRGHESNKVGNSMLETVWGRFIKAPQSWKKRRVMTKSPLEDGE